jgi:hypothetical protein
MNSHTTAQFRRAFAQLPAAVQQQARSAYRLFQQNPNHPSLRFRNVHPVRPIYSVRVGLDYRALGLRDGNTIIWFWIGPHAEYDTLLRQR